MVARTEAASLWVVALIVCLGMMGVAVAAAVAAVVTAVAAASAVDVKALGFSRVGVRHVSRSKA